MEIMAAALGAPSVQMRPRGHGGQTDAQDVASQGLWLPIWVPTAVDSQQAAAPPWAWLWDSLGRGQEASQHRSEVSSDSQDTCCLV